MRSEACGSILPRTHTEAIGSTLFQAHSESSGTTMAQMRSEACGSILPRTHTETSGPDLPQVRNEASGTVMPQIRDEENEAPCLKRTLSHRERAWLNCNWSCPCREFDRIGRETSPEANEPTVSNKGKPWLGNQGLHAIIATGKDATDCWKRRDAVWREFAHAG